jgi:hypothetical protein
MHAPVVEEAHDLRSSSARKSASTKNGSNFVISVAVLRCRRISSVMQIGVRVPFLCGRKMYDQDGCSPPL